MKRTFPKYAIEIWGGGHFGTRQFYKTETEARFEAADVIKEMQVDGIDGHVKVYGMLAGPPYCIAEL